MANYVYFLTFILSHEALNTLTIPFFTNTNQLLYFVLWVEQSGLSPGWGHCQLCGHGLSPVHVLHRVFFFYLFFNHTAMGRVWFMVCMGFIFVIFFNCMALGWAWFMFCAGFIFIYLFFLNHAAVGRTRFRFCIGFFFSFVSVQTQTSTRPSRGRDFESCNLESLFA